MRRSYLYCLLAVVLAVFSACSDEDNASGGKKPGTDGFFALDAASLKDWDYGVSDGRCCLVVKTDSVGGVLVCAIDKDSGRKYDFFVELDGDGRLTGLGTTDEYYATTESDDDYTLFKWNDSGELEGTTIPKTAASQKQASRVNEEGSGSVSPVKIANALEAIYRFVEKALRLDSDIQDGRWIDLFKDVYDMVRDAAKIFPFEYENLPKNVFPDVITVERVTQFKDIRLANNMNEIFNKAEIKITDISKQPDGTYVVNTEVSGVNSIKKGEIVVTTETSYVKGENHVYAGVVCRQDYSAFINYYDYISEEAEITRFEGDVVYLSFTLPALGNGTYHVKPYMRSSINFKLVGEGVQYVKYGNEEVINDIGGRITGFTQADAKFDGEHGGTNFVVYVSAEIDSNDGLEEWGVFLEGVTGDNADIYEPRFPADMPTAKVKDDIRVEFGVYNVWLDNIDFENCMASKTVRFGVYKKRKNPTGNFDYEYYDFGDKSEFTVVYDKKPEIIELYDARVIGQEEYYSEDYDRQCHFSFKAKVDGCLFLQCLQVDYGSAWNSGWKMPKEDLVYSKEAYMADGGEYTFESRYIYSSSGTEPYDIYIGNGITWSYAITCDNGKVSQPRRVSR